MPAADLYYILLGILNTRELHVQKKVVIFTH